MAQPWLTPCQGRVDEQRNQLIFRSSFTMYNFYTYGTTVFFFYIRTIPIIMSIFTCCITFVKYKMPKITIKNVAFCAPLHVQMPPFSCFYIEQDFIRVYNVI